MALFLLKCFCYASVRDAGGDEICPPEYDLGLRAGHPPEALVVEEEDEVPDAEAAVALDGAAGVDGADDGAAKLVGQGFDLDA